MLAAIHDAEIGEEEGGDQQRPEGTVEMSSERHHEADANAEEEAIDACGNVEKEHSEGAGIEVVGHRLGLTAHVRPEHLDGDNEGQTQENKAVGARKSLGVARQLETQIIAQKDAQAE